MGKIKSWASLTFRTPLQSDNINDTLKLNRFLANPLVLPLCVILIDGAIFLAFNFVVNVIYELVSGVKATIKGEEVNLSQSINADQIWMDLSDKGSIVKGIYLIFFIFIVILTIKRIYLIRLNFSEKAMNKGHDGTERWTTLKEIMKQYKGIEMKPSKTVKGEKVTNYFDGKGGLPVARWGDKLYVDSQTTNNLFIGTTRSGKGEMFVFPMIDIFSRAKEQINRPTLIIFDPKLELYKSSYKTMQDRGYKVRLLNLDNPIKSAGYNPLTIVTEYYKAGNIAEAQQLAKSFAFNIFNSNADTQEAIWKNTATDLFTALIISVVSDCIEEDRLNNSRRIKLYERCREEFDACDEEGKTLRREQFAKWYEGLSDKDDFLAEDYVKLLEDMTIPDYIGEGLAEQEIRYQPLYENERNINCFSVLNFFKELVDTSSLSTQGKEAAGVKKAESVLDDYFNQRGELDYARSLYASIKSAGDRTKGSIYVNMQSALTIFSQDNIARLTAESDINIKDLGFDTENPTAVFIGLPTEDRTNHFLALTFIAQSFQYLWKLSKEGNNKLPREVVYMMDEFGNMPVMDNFAGMVTNCLGAGMSFNIFLQSYAQLHSKYEMDQDTIKDNFANQVYILATGNDSSNEFSELLGNKTVIEVQRSGGILSMDKNILENNKQVPLLQAGSLRDLYEGEAVIYRVSKRTDRAGAAIRSYPIIIEYANKLTSRYNIKAFFKTIKSRKKEGPMKDRDTKKSLPFNDELRFHISYYKRLCGTAFLFRYQYATEDFPNPTEIRFLDVFNEKSRDCIDYENRVVVTDKIKDKIADNLSLSKKKSKEKIDNDKKTLEWVKKNTPNSYAKWEAAITSSCGQGNWMELAQITDNLIIDEAHNRLINYLNAQDMEVDTAIKSKQFLFEK